MKTVFLAVFVLASVVAKSQQEVLSFLRSNSANISGANISNLLFDDAFYRHQYFFFGEHHGSANPQQTDYALFTHLHQRANVKFYIAEVDFTKAALLNQFLASGDTVLLQKVFQSWQRDTAQWANKEHFQKWVRFHQYQKTIPSAKQFVVIGVDVPQDLSLVAEQLKEFSVGKETGWLSSYMDSLQQLAETHNRRALVELSKRLHPLVDSAKESIKKSLGTKHLSFLHLLKSFTFLNAGHNRDKVMYLNLVNQLQLHNLNTAKMYGFLGFFHCLQTGYNKSMPMAALLKQDMAGKNNIVTLGMLALDSEVMLPFAGPIRQMMPPAYVEKLLNDRPGFPKTLRYIPYVLSNDNAQMKAEGIDALKEVSTPSSTWLFRLSGKDSPYQSTNSLAEIKGFQTLTLTNPSDGTLAAFQYVILFRNSVAAQPLGE